MTNRLTHRVSRSAVCVGILLGGSLLGFVSPYSNSHIVNAIGSLGLNPKEKMQKSRRKILIKEYH